MESWTMTRDGDGLRTGESGARKGESECRVSGTNVGSSGRLDCRRAREKREKRANFRGNKATMWFRMSHLIQKWPKNKANFWFISHGAQQAMPVRRENKANLAAGFPGPVILSVAKNLALGSCGGTNRDSSLRSE